MKRPKVTIMIPTYNQEAYILEAVESARRQTYRNLEILIGNDASTDRTGVLLDAVKDPRIRRIDNQTNLGRLGNYRNLLGSASGEWVVNLDGDDYFTHDGFIEEAIDLWAGDPDTVIIAARASWRSSKRLKTSQQPKEHELPGGQILRRLPDKKVLFKHMATLYRKELAEKIGFYYMDCISSDWESLYRLAMLGKVKYLDRVVGTWRKHGSNLTSSADYQDLAANLEIWPSIFRFAVQHGFNPVMARLVCARCISYYAHKYALRLKRIKSHEGRRFIAHVLRSYMDYLSLTPHRIIGLILLGI